MASKRLSGYGHRRLARCWIIEQFRLQGRTALERVGSDAYPNRISDEAGIPVRLDPDEVVRSSADPLFTDETFVLQHTA
jgi:hypothetical protein